MLLLVVPLTLVSLAQGQFGQCQVGWSCVPREKCLKGVAHHFGEGIIGVRNNLPPDAPCTSLGADVISGVCCRNPTGGVSAASQVRPQTPGLQLPFGPSSPGVGATNVTCPAIAVCMPDIACTGDVLNVQGNFQPINSGGSWAQCVSAHFDIRGVCCNNPFRPSTPDPFLAETLGQLRTATECGIRNDFVSTKIQGVGKSETSFAEFPWQAIIFMSNFTFKCGASLISDRFLLTGAHCVKDQTPFDIRVRLGEWQVNAFSEPLQFLDFFVSNIILHPGFKAANLINDIALLELETPVTSDFHMNEICLPEPLQSFVGQRCIASGWGKETFTGHAQNVLKKVDLPVIPRESCQLLLKKTRLGPYFLLHESFMCAGGEENKDACTGDGGGPLACQDPSTGHYVLAGITAWGIGCGTKDVPGVYVDVQHFLPWIQENI